MMGAMVGCISRHYPRPMKLPSRQQHGIMVADTTKGDTHTQSQCTNSADTLSARGGSSSRACDRSPARLSIVLLLTLTSQTPPLRHTQRKLASLVHAMHHTIFLLLVHWPELSWLYPSSYIPTPSIPRPLVPSIVMCLSLGRLPTLVDIGNLLSA